MSRISAFDLLTTIEEEPKKSYKTALTLTKEVVSNLPIDIQNSFTVLGTLPTNLMASSSKPAPSKSVKKKEWFYGPIIDRVLILEPPIIDQFPSKNPVEITNYLLPHTHFYLADNFQKSQKYYEQILINTKSANFTYTHDKNDPSKVIYCKILMLNTITLKEWGQPPGKNKEFQLPNKGPILKYNYWDYIDAWFRAFYFQNKEHTFSMFFHVGYEFSYPTPNWFRPWWETYGPHIDYAPSEVFKAFKKFETQFVFKPEYQDSAPWMIFSQLFRVPWIIMTEFHIEKDVAHDVSFWSLCRLYKTSWWDGTEISQCTEPAVDRFFEKHQKLTKFPKAQMGKNAQKEALKAKKASLIEKIQNCDDEKEIEKLMDELVKTKNVSDSESDAGSLWDDSQQPFF